MQFNISFSEHFCVQMTILLPDTIKECSLERKHPFLTEIVLLMHNFFVQYIAPLEKEVNLIQKINLFCHGQLAFCQIRMSFIIFEVQNSPVTIHDKIEVICISPEMYTYFSSAIIYCPI